MQKISAVFLSVVLIIIFSPYLTVAQNETVSSLPGQIAYIGADNNVYVLIPQDNQTNALTLDGSSTIQYRWPTWSTDNRLAYFLTKVIDQNVETDIFVAPTGQDNGLIVYKGSNEAFTYAAWAPQNCQ